MKTTRRQELRTNELSQQIDQAGVYVKQNAAIFTVVIVAAAALVVGGFWYSSRQDTIESDAWDRLRAPEANDDTMAVIDRYQAVADERVNDALTTTARLRIGDLALSRIGMPPPATEDGPQVGPDAAELTAKARAAFEEIITSAADDLTAYGHAMMAMGVIEEDAGQFDKARQWYKRLTEEERLSSTPFKSEAEYRLAGLDIWSQEVVFPPPPPMEMGPPAPMDLDSPPNRPLTSPANLPLTSPGTKIERLEPGDIRIPALGESIENLKEIPISTEPAKPAAPAEQPSAEEPGEKPAAEPVQPRRVTPPPASETPKRSPTTQPAGN
jgi:hypothetical protein